MNFELLNVTNIYAQRSGHTEESGKTAGSRTGFAEQMSRSRKGESAVEEYKKKHPKDAARVDSMVRSGKTWLSKNGGEAVSREDMSMEEYKDFIMGLLNRIPFDISRIGDRELISISEKGWEQMKNDPDYEAWVLGYTVQNRSVRNPFAGLPGASADLYVEKFGASIEEHLGQSVPMMGAGKGFSTDGDEESWWEKRHKRMREWMEEQEKKAQSERKAQQMRAMQEYRRQAFEEGQRPVDVLAGLSFSESYHLPIL